MPVRTEALVIGAGPGGYVAAIRLGQLGKDVTLVEKDRLGGECLNYGCIPSKALITAAKLVHRIRGAAVLGIDVSDVKVDLPRLQRWKSGIVERLVAGIAHLCKGNHVNVIHGEAHFLSPRRIEIRMDEGREQIEADNVIIATGSRPIALPSLEFDGERIISSKEALELSGVPARLLVVGGGVIGVEIGTVYAKLGSHVTVVELTDQLLPGTDKELVRVVARNLQKLSVQVHVKSQVTKVERTEQGVRAAVATEVGKVDVEADRILVSVGRRPHTQGLGLENIGVSLDAKGFIKVDKALRTNIDGIYAIGDVAGPPFLAHKASREGIVAAEAIAGLPSQLDYRALPDAIFTDPEIATVGLTEAAAKQQEYDISVGRFPFSASGRALIADEADGFVKVVAEREGGRLLGVQIVGPEASDLISEAALAIEMGATAEDIALTIHPHPTLPESLMEAAEAAVGKAIHILRL